MRHFLLFATCTVWLGAAQDLPNTLTPKESADGWKLLFDGKTLHGWESHWAEDWTARDGELVCSAAERSWLSTSDSFSDYLFKVEFRGAGSVNSGVFLRSEKEGQPHITGYELQIWDYQPAGYKTGSLVGSLKAAPVKNPARSVEPLRDHRPRRSLHDHSERQEGARRPRVQA